MPLVTVLVLAVLGGAGEVLPISSGGHTAIATLWLGTSGAADHALSLELNDSANAVRGLFRIGVVLAMAAAVRQRAAVALTEGLRAIARPVLFRTSPGARDAAIIVLASTTTLIVAAAVRRTAEAGASSPLAVGLGLVTTALVLASTGFAAKGSGDTLSLFTAAFAGSAQGMATLPGCSGIAAVLGLLLWRGLKPAATLELALLIAIPGNIGAIAQDLLAAPDGALAAVDVGTIVLGLVVTFLAASIACAALRNLLERRRLAFMALWLLPLGIATLAWGRAVPPNEANNANESTPPQEAVHHPGPLSPVRAGNRS